jgi:phospholipase/carboxylesterase
MPKIPIWTVLTLFLFFPVFGHAQENARDILDTDLFALRQRAMTAHRDGEFAKALPLYLELLKFNRRNPTTLYNLACCYARQGEVKPACDCLWQAVQCGFEGLDHIERDGDFAPIREKAPFRKTLATMGEYLRNKGRLYHIEAPRLMPYRLRLPRAHQPDKPTSLVIALHGNGGNPDTFHTLAPLFDEQDLILVMPQGAYTHPQDGMLPMYQYTFGLPSQDRNLWKKADLATVAYIAELARELRRLHAIDKIYILGFSEGGVFAYQTAILHPDLFSGIIVFGASLPRTDQPWSILNPQGIQNAAAVKVFIGHGEDDPAVSVDEARKAYKILSEAGFKVRIGTLPGGHGIPPQLLKEALAWMRK